MPSSSRIIGAERLSDVRPFTLSDLAKLSTSGRPRPRPAGTDPAAGAAPDDPVFEAGRQAGLREGFRQGADAARAQIAREQADAQARRQASATLAFEARLAGLGDALAREFAELEQAIAADVVDLAIDLARQTVRHVLRVDRGAIVSVAQEAVSALIDERASFALHANPAEAALVETALGSLLASRNGRVVPDPAVAAGGCRVVSAGAEIDATVATRWRRVLASIGHQPAAGDPLDEGVRITGEDVLDD